MMLLRNILTVGFLVLCIAASAQEFEVVKSDSVAKIEGDEYVIHIVEAKQTLFSIAKTYQVKLSRIAFDNPGVLDGLKLGQSLRILKSAQGETVEIEAENETLEVDGNYVLYTVPAKQTLYAISKEYNTTVSAILDANPDLADGLKVGSTIRVPVPKMLGNSNTTKEELVGLPDITIAKATELFEKEISRASGNIALMLPFYLTQNDTLEARRLEEEPESIYSRSEIGLAFYEGFLLALDTLKKMGFESNVSVFDTENRPWKVQQMIKNGDLDNFDLIIGPMYGKVFSSVADYGYANCIPVVSPTLKSSAEFESNDYALKILPSQESMMFEMGNHLALSDSTHNVIVHYGTPAEQKLLWAFKKGLEAKGVIPPSFSTVDLSTSTRDSLKRTLSLVDRNNIVVLSSDEVKMASLFRAMTKWQEDAYIVIYGPNSWQRFKNVEMDYFEKFRVHLPTPFFIDYKQVETELFVQKFRRKFKTEPSSFAFRGYDIGMHLIRNLNEIRVNGLEYLTALKESGFQSKFGWKRLPNGGLENNTSHIVDHTNYELKIAID